MPGTANHLTGACACKLLPDGENRAKGGLHLLLCHFVKFLLTERKTKNPCFLSYIDSKFKPEKENMAVERTLLRRVEELGGGEINLKGWGCEHD